MFCACNSSVPCMPSKLYLPQLTRVYTTPIIRTQTEQKVDNIFYLFNHPFDLPLLAEHHVVQVFDPLTEICCFRPQLFGPENRNGSRVSSNVCWRRREKMLLHSPESHTEPGEFLSALGTTLKMTAAHGLSCCF